MLKLNKRMGSFILVFLFIYIRFSLWFLGTSETLQTILSIFLFVFYQLIFEKKIVFKQRSLIFILIIFSFIILSCIVNGSSSNLELGTILQWIIALWLVNTLSRYEFCSSYINVLYVLSLFSIIIFLLELTYPSFLENFPYITTTKWIGDATKGNIRNIFVSVVALNANNKRNWGIFYEPGMFAFYLNLAIFMELFISKNKNQKKIIILVGALITTMSTNGYISFIFMIIAFFLQKNNIIYNEGKHKNLKLWIFHFSCLITLLMIVFFINNPERWRFFISKLGELNSASTSGSGYERISALKYAWSTFLYNPITGVTNTRISFFYNGNISTFTPLQWLASYGLIYGIICNIGFGLTAFNKYNSLGSNIIKCIALFTMVFSQNMTSNSIILSFIIYNVIELFERK